MRRVHGARSQRTLVAVAQSTLKVDQRFSPIFWEFEREYVKNRMCELRKKDLTDRIPPSCVRNESLRLSIPNCFMHLLNRGRTFVCFCVLYVVEDQCCVDHWIIAKAEIYTKIIEKRLPYPTPL